jgi:hypothetical protein
MTIEQERFSRLAKGLASVPKREIDEEKKKAAGKKRSRLARERRVGKPSASDRT